MEEIFFEDKTFDHLDFVQTPLPRGEYEYCTFNHCLFSRADLSNSCFLNCSFVECDLSMAHLHKTSLNEVHFRNCKMLGMRFDQCNGFGLSFGFERCQLNHSSFYGVRIKTTLFRYSQLQEVDFTGADLSAATFDHCDLTNARFEQTILEKADFRTSLNYSLDPELNRIGKALFSMEGLPGLLGKYDIKIERI